MNKQRQKQKITLFLDGGVGPTFKRSDANIYVGHLVRRNWYRWRRALHQVQQGGMTLAQIAEACQTMNGFWMVRDWGLDHLPEQVPANLRQEHFGPLEILAWEYWHNNQELRDCLAGGVEKDEFSEQVEIPEPAPPPKKRGRPRKNPAAESAA